VDISKRIVELRKQQNISTNKLANKSGISQSYLREIELGLKNPTMPIFVILSPFLYSTISSNVLLCVYITPVGSVKYVVSWCRFQEIY